MDEAKKGINLKTAIDLDLTQLLYAAAMDLLYLSGEPSRLPKVLVREDLELPGWQNLDR